MCRPGDCYLLSAGTTPRTRDVAGNAPVTSRPPDYIPLERRGGAQVDWNRRSTFCLLFYVYFDTVYSCTFLSFISKLDDRKYANGEKKKQSINKCSG